MPEIKTTVRAQLTVNVSGRNVYAQHLSGEIRLSAHGDTEEDVLENLAIVIRCFQHEYDLLVEKNGDA